jgi:hypothetical protein
MAYVSRKDMNPDRKNNIIPMTTIKVQASAAALQIFSGGGSCVYEVFFKQQEI